MAKGFEAGEFEAVFHRHKDMVFKTAYLLLDDAKEAEDVLQEVFAKVHKSINTFDLQRGVFKTWLHRITVNQCISERRRRHLSTVSVEQMTEQGLDLQSTSQLPEEALMKQKESEDMRQAIKSLDAKHRAVVVLRYFHDLSYREIAQVLEVPLGTVKSRLNAAIRVLRHELHKGGFTP